jgi:enoyl-CoA hydratase/carnithine racemase
MNYGHISVERTEAAIWVTLNRPEAANTFKPPDTFKEIGCVFDSVRQDPAIKAFVVTGAGERAFCMGSDLGMLQDAFASRNFSLFRDYLQQINAFLFELEELPVPTIAMVQGKARAGGFEMLLACDFVLVASEALIGDVHTPFGHMPGAGTTQRLARKVGIQKSMDIILTGRWLDAQEAVNCGLALKHVPRSGLRAATEEFLMQFSDKTRESLWFCKRAILRGWDLPLRDGIAFETQSYLEYLATSEEPTQIFWRNQKARTERLGHASLINE